MTSYLGASGICKSFAGGPRSTSRPVLTDVSFTVERGEAVAVLGVNGAGKSTLMRIVAGILHPDKGSVYRPPMLGALIELGAGFHPDANGRKNLRQAFTLHGVHGAQIEEKIDLALEFSGLDQAHHDKPLRHYSSGMIARLGFAFVVALHPDALISDEILAVGDDAFQRKCITWLEGYQQTGGTLLLVSHNLYHVKKLCQRALWLHDGRIRHEGPCIEVCQEYESYHARSDTGGAASTALVLTDSDGRNRAVFQMGETVHISGGTTGGTWRIALPTGDVLAEGVVGRSGKLPTEILLPGTYRVTVSDPSGSQEAECQIRGDSRLFGIARLERQWM